MACPEALAKAYTEEEFDKTREEGGDFNNSEVADDVQVTSTGDDTPGIAGGTDMTSNTNSLSQSTSNTSRRYPRTSLGNSSSLRPRP
jgi:hypothetical protein